MSFSNPINSFLNMYYANIAHKYLSTTDSLVDCLILKKVYIKYVVFISLVVLRNDIKTHLIWALICGN